MSRSIWSNGDSRHTPGTPAPDAAEAPEDYLQWLAEAEWAWLEAHREPTE